MREILAVEAGPNMIRLLDRIEPRAGMFLSSAIALAAFALLPVATSAQCLPAAGEGAKALAATCPPIVIESTLGSAGATGWAAKTTGQALQYPSQIFQPWTCNAPTLSVAPNFAEPARTYDAYEFRMSASTQTCVSISLTVLNETVADFIVRANSPGFVFDNIEAGWRGDPGEGSGIPPKVTSFSSFFDPGEVFEVVVLDMQATGTGQPYRLSISDENCGLAGIFIDGFE